MSLLEQKQSLSSGSEEIEGGGGGRMRIVLGDGGDDILKLCPLFSD